MGVYISAAHKSSGKTTLSLGLCAALKARGHQVQAFKKGPDYIDPLWLSAAAGRPCINLDFNTASHDELRALYAHYAEGADVRLVEGNKGLFDGVSLSGEDSNAALAELLGLPVILVIDTEGITRGIAPLLVGYQAFGAGLDIAGVILNRVGGPRHESKLVAAVETYTDIPVLGAVRKQRSLMLEEKHLGLIPANEDALASAKIDHLRAMVDEQVDLHRIASLAAPSAEAGAPQIRTLPPRTTKAPSARQSLSIGIARDAAFGFYYHDDLQAFEDEGVELVPFSPLEDTCLPRVDGLFFGGGFPERHLAEITANQTMREEISKAIEGGMPTYAECGGLMYLTREIEWRGNRAEAVGVIPAKTVMLDVPQGRGYMELKETGKGLWPRLGNTNLIRAHEFHYSRLEGLPDDLDFAYEVLRGQGIADQKDGFVYKNLLANYAHLRHQRSNPWVKRFVEFVRACR